MASEAMSGGIPCWFELASTEPSAAGAFYAALFGWSRETIDMGPIGPYTFLRNGSGMVGAMMGLTPDQRSAGVPSHWGVYFSAPDCDAVAARAVAAGARELLPPTTVEGQGRMAVLRDPTDAVFSLWQPLDPTGAGPVMFEDNAVCWVELATRDQPAAAAFYAGLFGWHLDVTDVPLPGGLKYVQIAVGGRHYGGILPMTDEWAGIPPHWAIYVHVADVDATVARAKDLGGSVPVPAFDAKGVGRIALVGDPSGAMCYLIRLARGA